MSKQEHSGTAEVQGIQLHYQRTGTGEAVILIAGLGSNADLWLRQTAALATSHEVVTFDNRGSARSEVPTGPYTIQTMAADTVQLLDALDIAAAHVVGTSMGAMIAQEVAIQYPDKALTLTLMGAQPGGAHAFVPPAEETAALEALATTELEPTERARAWLPHVFSEAFITSNKALVDEYVQISSRYPTSTEGLKAQWAALMSYDSWDRLPWITAPTLVLHGSLDKLVPVENADALCVRIPNSRVAIIDGAGHSISYEAADAVNDLLFEFFAENRYVYEPDGEQPSE
ncbi:MAG: alpha/beta fold hydrolase [Chloroflexota bacterium]